MGIPRTATLLLLVAALGTVTALASPQEAWSGPVLWDLIIDANMVGNAQVHRGQIPAVEGTVTDHAGSPVAGAAIVITSGVLVFDTRTDADGAFRQPITGFDGLPGSYVANVKAVDGDRLGATGLTFQVTGEVYASEVLYEQIAGGAAQQYINASESDYANDPIGAKMYRHYQDIYAEYLEALAAEGRIRSAEAEEASRKERAGMLLQQEVAQKRPGAGVYDGNGYRVFVHGLDDSIRDTITSQINHTRAAFDDARQVMRSMLEAGSSYEEARAAYLDRLAITKEEMGRVGYDAPGRHAPADEGPPDEAGGEGVTATPPKETPLTAAQPQVLHQVAPNATAAAHAPPPVHITGRAPTVVVPDGGSVFIEVGGLLQEFILNGTRLVPVTGPPS